MKIRFIIFTLSTLIASSASAETLYLHCFRYESKCLAEKCYQIADRLVENLEWKATLSAEKMEPIDYVVRDNSAVGITTKTSQDAKLEGGKYTVLFKSVTQDDARILLEYKNEAGFVRESVAVEKQTGFYANYLLHTDSTIKDTPVGKPYVAYFGWCEDTTATHGVYTPKPAASKTAPATNALIPPSQEPPKQ